MLISILTIYILLIHLTFAPYLLPSKRFSAIYSLKVSQNKEINREYKLRKMNDYVRIIDMNDIESRREQEGGRENYLSPLLV